jgi:recombination protein RecA
MSNRLPVITKMLQRKRTALVIINQTRDKIGVAFGDPVTTPGGNTLKFMAGWRCQLWKGSAIKSDLDNIGQYTTIKCVKNKYVGPRHKVKLRLDFHVGWNNEWSTIDFAKTRGLIPKAARRSKKTFEEAVEQLIEEKIWLPK